MFSLLKFFYFIFDFWYNLYIGDSHFLWCYWFKTLQKPSTKSTRKCFFFSIRLSDRLRRSFEGCDPGWKSNIGSNVLRINKNHVFFDEGFFGSRIFSLFLLAQKEFLGQNLQRFNAFGDAIFFGFACFYSEMERERGAVWRAVFPRLCGSMPLCSEWSWTVLSKCWESYHSGELRLTFSNVRWNRPKGVGYHDRKAITTDKTLPLKRQNKGQEKWSIHSLQELFPMTSGAYCRMVADSGCHCSVWALALWERHL